MTLRIKGHNNVKGIISILLEERYTVTATPKYEGYWGKSLDHYEIEIHSKEEDNKKPEATE